MPILYKIDRKEGFKENQLEFINRKYGLMSKTNKQTEIQVSKPRHHCGVVGETVYLESGTCSWVILES